MATYTDNYNLTKPTMNELADIRVINGNMDTVDTVMHGSQTSIADAYDPTLTYDVDDLVMNDFLLYKCITAVTVPEAFDVNKWQRTTAVNEGGTPVEANPSGTASVDLTKIEIDGVLYNIVGGGGGGSGSSIVDELFENQSLTGGSGTTEVSHSYTMSSSIDDYDAVVVEYFNVVKPNGDRFFASSIMVMKDDYYLRRNDVQPTEPSYVNGAFSIASRELRFGFEDNTTMKTVTSPTREVADVEAMVYKVYGIKFGGGVDYSTTEQVIGTWLGETLYRKVIYIGALNYITGDNPWTSVAHNISNVKTFINVSGFFKGTNDGRMYNIPSYRVGGTKGISIGADTTNVYYMNNWIDGTNGAYVILEYTKATV